MCLAAAGCLLLSGCDLVAISVGDAGTTFHYPWWVPMAIVGTGLIVVALGFVVRNIAGWKTWVIVLMGLAFTVVFAPMMARDRVFVNNQELEFPRPGFMAGKQEIEFDTVASVRIASEWTKDRYPRAIEILYFDGKYGRAVRFPLNNDINLAAAKTILAGVRKNGVPIHRR